MEDDELEEGEACSGAWVDPDVDLSYIDAKVQDVLGHFQKDFEGGVSMENLGAKFGGYGSFLPAYQRSPSIWSQPRSPPKAPSHNVSKSPYNQSFEGAHQNRSVRMSASIYKNSTASTAQPLENSGKKDKCVNTLDARESNINHGSINKPVNGGDQKTLKVRIKVGTNNISARNNAAAIYSGLGLDVSPISSPEDSPDCSGGFSSELHDLPHESPSTILQIMTGFPVLGGFLLSPLPDSLLRITEKGSPYLKNCHTGTLCKDIPDTDAFLADLTSPMGDANRHVEKKMKPAWKTSRFTDEKNSNFKDDMITNLKREIDVEALEGRELVSSALNIPLLTSCSKGVDVKAEAGQLVVSDALDTRFLSGPKGFDRKMEKQITGESAKHTSRLFDICRDSNRTSVKVEISSPASVKKNLLDLTESLESNRAGHLGNETMHVKVKLCSKISSSEKAPEERKTSNHKNALLDLQREGSGIHEKNYDVVKAYSDGSKRKMDHLVGPTEHSKQKSVWKATSYEQDREMLQGNGLLSEGKRKSKGSKPNATPSAEFSKSNLGFHSSTPSKEKKSFQTRGDCAESKSKALKSHRESCKGLNEEFDRGVLGNQKAEEVDNGTGLLETHSKDKLKDTKLGNDKPKGRPSGKSEAVMKVPVVTPLTSAPTSDAVAAPNDPVPMEDNWVCCDKCQTWRLLPYGTNTDDLPKKWKCRMQIWLPGLNRCSISEEETVKAFHALYQVPVPENGTNLNGHHDVGASTLAVAQHLDQNLEPTTHNVSNNGKKKHGLKDTSTVPNHSTVTKFSDPVKKNQHVSIKSKNLNDAKTVSLELDPLNRVGFEQMSGSADLTMQKQHKLKEKYKSFRRSSDGAAGDSIAQSSKHSIMKSKREINEDDFRISKKIKTHGSHCPEEDWLSDHDVAGKAVSSMGHVLSTNGKYLQKYKDNSYSIDSRCDSKDNFPALNKKSNLQVRVISDGEVKGHFSASDIERSDKVGFAAKKRKVKEWQESQANQEILTRSQHHGDQRVNVNEEFSESELRKEKKAKVSKSERKESRSIKADGTMDKKGRITRILLSGSREQLADGMDESRRVAGREHRVGQYQGNAASQQSLDGNNCLKRDLSNAQPSRAANSSSSKVSGSRKSKANFQDARGSPVESVSSSPLRVSKTEKHDTRRNLVGKDDAINLVKDDAINLGFSALVSLKKCSGGEVDGGSERSGSRKEKASFVQHRSLKSRISAESGVQDSSRGICYQDEVSNHLSGGKANGTIHLKTSGSKQCNLLPTELEETKLVDGSANILDQHKVHVNNKDKLNEPPDKGRLHDQDIVNNHHHTNGSSQKKSSKSSSCSTGRYRSSESDLDGNKLKGSNSFGEREEFHPAKSGSTCGYESDRNSHYHFTYKENLRDEDYNFQENKVGKDNLGKKGTIVDRRVNHLHNGVPENMDAHVPSSNDKSNLHGNLQQEPSHNNDKSSVHLVLDRIDRSEATSGREKSESLLSSRDKQETQCRGPYSVHTPQEESSLEVFPLDAANGAAPDVVKQANKSDNQNVACHSSLRHPTPDGLDARNPIRKYNQSAALKEARDLKHTANHLKDEGLELESTRLYFQASLKFLHVASLWEPSSADITKYEEVTQSMRMYIETARLCKFCAHAYERYKQMAAAALAYKCMEVAYFKVAYFKHPVASKDQQELQTALQVVLPGESPSSPSSSASDVDNLNNQGALDKAASVKGVNSPQTAGNHVIAARYRPIYTRWLDYTNETIVAFEASRKAQNAFAAAAASLEKETNAMSSIKEVLNFDFHNVEELLRLIRLSMEYISC